MAAGRYDGWSWMLRAHILKYKHETERELRMLLGLEPQTPSPSDISCSKATPPNPDQTVPPIGGQVAKLTATMGEGAFHSSHDRQSGSPCFSSSKNLS